MKPRERVFAALQHGQPDRVPRFEIWIDALLQELGEEDPAAIYAHVGQDCILMPTSQPPSSNTWKNGVDEWGRVWRNGSYTGGVVDSYPSLATYTPPIDSARQFFDPTRIFRVREAYPNHCLIFGTHIGPFTAGYMAMGFERFFSRLVEDPSFAHALLEARTEWCITIYREAVAAGAEVLVLGDDAGHGKGPMISPGMWRKFVLPYHRRVVDALPVPVIWHSDGNIEALLPMAIEAGFAGIHGLDPMAGMDLGHIKREYGRDLALVGNVDIRVLFGDDLHGVRDEVNRCLAAGAGGGYMIATCNSICAGMNPAAVAEFFRYEAQVVG